MSNVIEPNGMMTSYSYDALGNMNRASMQCLGRSGDTCGAAGPIGPDRTFSYNAFGEMVSVTNPESGSVTS